MTARPTGTAVRKSVYEHIPLELLQPTTRVKAVCLDLAIRGQKVGYLPGAGDRTAESLAAMGYAVTTLNGMDLTPDRLRAFDAVVLGVRAFNVRTDLVLGLSALFAYVEGGGTVVEQYNTPNELKTTRLAPFELELSRDLPHNRVTNEKAPVTFLAPDNPALTTPNRITQADFDGWVQERGLNFPSRWDHEHFSVILACSDPGEAPLDSGLLVANYGKGHFVYTGLSFFRQLPAGGAWGISPFRQPRFARPMKPEATRPRFAPGTAEEEKPGSYSWRTIYLLVLASFVLWVALLTALPRLFS